MFLVELIVLPDVPSVNEENESEQQNDEGKTAENDFHCRKSIISAAVHGE